MAAADGARSADAVRHDIEQERDELARAVVVLREDLAEATDVSGKLKSKLPLVAAGGVGLGFVVAGGVGATIRLLFRRGREGDEKARVGRYSLVDRD